ncbi:MAG: hypothetical protein EOP48_10685 [Sphingobacteriales bacterium]|nr:MAG: hypothetical protein EOP48_10685 [Sphingobacteriales bacterium]
MANVLIFGDCTTLASGEPNSTAVAVGPRLILTCAHCLTSINAGRTRGSLIYNENYWVQPSVKLERSGSWSSAGRISVVLFKYHVENDWALLVREDGGYFEDFADIDMAPSHGNTPRFDTVDVFHCPVRLLLGNFQTHAGEYVLGCNRSVNNAVQSHTSHHLYYESRGLTRGSSGGAVYLSGSIHLFAMHCERIGEVDYEEEPSENIQDPKGKRVSSEEYPYDKVVGPLPPAKKAKKACDSESVVKSLASGNEGQGRALIISQYPRLIYYITEINK